MSPPPPYSEVPKALLEPELSITATSLKRFIVKRDIRFAAFIVKFILRNFESLNFETPQPLGWSFFVLNPPEIINSRMKMTKEP
jgi:hypothetical protein